MNKKATVDNKITRALKAISGTLALGLVSACSLDPTELPLPGTHVGEESYPISIEFTSVLSLTAKAKVEANGVQIGVLDHVKLDGTTAVAVVNISSIVKLPQNTRAELRQTTLLGDIYIALTPPSEPSAAVLRGGDVIPLKNTEPPLATEDLLRSLASVVSGGSLTGLSDTFSSLHKVFGQNPGETEQLQRELADMLHDLATNRAAIDQIVTSADAATSTTLAQLPVLGALQERLRGEIKALDHFIPSIVQTIRDLDTLLRTANPIVDQVVPGLSQSVLALTPLIAALSTSDTNLSVLLNRGLGLLRDGILAYTWKDGGPRFTVNAVNVPDNALVLGGADPQDRADDMIKTLQTMGLVPR